MEHAGRRNAHLRIHWRLDRSNNRHNCYAMITAPAKLNLFLHIIGRRVDGYHELQTVFQLLDFGDDIDLNVRDDGVIRRLGNDAVPMQADLTVRAASAFKQACKTPLGVDITLHKRLPMGGGLGGGSSDAAAVLRSLGTLWGESLDPDLLGRIALTLGADVPVFLAGTSAFAEGVGEKLAPMRLGESWYVVLCPDCEVSTADVFGASALTRNTKPLKIADFLNDDQSANTPNVDAERLLAVTRNDCEAVVRAKYPPVDNALRWLSRHGDARMTGTGACVFARFASRQAAQDVHSRAPLHLRAFVAKGVDEVAI